MYIYTCINYIYGSIHTCVCMYICIHVHRHTFMGTSVCMYVSHDEIFLPK